MKAAITIITCAKVQAKEYRELDTRKRVRPDLTERGWG